MSEYEIWRRWEDCLFFQEALETEYRRLARMKRQRLKDGKGVKKGGFYKQDMAASFESLPPGPDPDSVAQDIHDHLPRLNKKGTVFRASQATIDQRHAELKAFVEALMKDDVPALLLELRSDRLVTDFFGYWRRDYDLAQKQQRPVSSKGRSSISGSSIFSAYFASSNGSNADLDSDSTSKSESPSKRKPSRSSTPSQTAQSKRPHQSSNASVSVPPSIVESQRLRALSTTSSDSSTPSSSSRSSGSSLNLSNPRIAGDSPLLFDHHPDHPDHPSSLQSLPEVREPSVKYDANGRLVASGGRIRGNSTGDIQSPPSSITSVGPTTGLQSNTQASRMCLHPYPALPSANGRCRQQFCSRILANDSVSCNLSGRSQHLIFWWRPARARAVKNVCQQFCYVHDRQLCRRHHPPYRCGGIDSASFWSSQITFSGFSPPYETYICAVSD